MKIQDDKPKIVIVSSGINETIFKYVIEEMSETKDIMENIAEKRIQDYMSTAIYEEIGDMDLLYEKVYSEVLEITANQEANIEDISNSNLSYTMIEFYTLIAMTCLYGGILGMTAINQNLANMSNNGKRVSVSKASKGKIILSSLLASYIVQLVGLALLFIYTVFVLKVDYGTNLPLIILLGVVRKFSWIINGNSYRISSKSKRKYKNRHCYISYYAWLFFIRYDGYNYEIYN